jgi:hypothetical protein
LDIRRSLKGMKGTQDYQGSEERNERRPNQYKDSGHVVTETVFRGRMEKCAFGEDSGYEDPGGGYRGNGTNPSGELLTKHTRAM